MAQVGSIHYVRYATKDDPRAACGMFHPNMRKTKVAGDVTCPQCLATIRLPKRKK